MISQNLRRKFLKFFKEREHRIVPSSAVIPHDDPTLLFINAGMNQFKDVFLGKSRRDYTKAASSQKCVRAGGKHNDLENVGHTSRHLTFFEMLGNFSFGDYFKKEAIAFAWQVTTEVFEFDPKFITATVFHEDRESFELWREFLPVDRIIGMGEKDNFWAMGETGPCGPCTELLYDRGEAFGTARNPNEDETGERFFEFWNLVFMQYNRKSHEEIEPLPKQSVDTGAGLERIASLKMGVKTLFETDILRELIHGVEELFSQKYDPQNQQKAPAFHVIADHLRTLSFAIADGAQPSNIERGYVLRKILRRAVRYARLLGREEPFLALLLPRLISTMGEDFPELKSSQERIAELLTLEEENFFRTLKRGGNLLNRIMTDATHHAHMISGEDAFKLKDTYGLPLDEIILLAKDSNLSVDLTSYEKLEAEAKERSRKARKESAQTLSEQLFEKHLESKGKTHFVGYKEIQAHAKITALMREGVFVESLMEGQEGIVFLDDTPFYAEKGGQSGDRGTIAKATALFEVDDTKTPFPDVVIHQGVLKEGSLAVGESVLATIDLPRREKIANNHTATHLLHLALQKVLGEHIRQAGSVVEPGRLRFDFNHHKSLTHEEIQTLEHLINEMIRANTRVETYELSLEEAQKKREIKQFFGEKYGSKVRVVDIGESKELCGGTHASSSGSIGLFKIMKEGSIAAGVRRIEAVTGIEALEMMNAASTELATLNELLKAPSGEVIKKVESLLEENKFLLSEIEKLRKGVLRGEVEKLQKEIQNHSGVPILIKALSMSGDELKSLADLLMESQDSLALFVFMSDAQKSTFLVRVSSDLVKKGIRADSWMKEVVASFGGKGGGKADSAGGGGPPLTRPVDLLNKARTWIDTFCSKNS